MSYPDGLFVLDRPAQSEQTESQHTEKRSALNTPVVVLVHGSLDRANIFRRTMRRLEDVRIVTYDRRGYQESRGTQPPLGVQGHIDDLIGVLHEVGGKPAVVGHSLGGLIAIGAALKEPSCFGALGAFEPPIRWLPIEGQEPRRRWLAGDEPDAAVEAFFRARVSDDAWERLEPGARADRLADGPALVAEMSSIAGNPLFDVTAISVPVLLGIGGRTEQRHHENLAWLVEHVEGAQRFEITEAGHGAHLSHPKAFANFVRATMARSSEHDALGAIGSGSNK